MSTGNKLKESYPSDWMEGFRYNFYFEKQTSDKEVKDRNPNTPRGVIM